MARFSGKTVLITGGTTGIGFASAKAFQAEGARVIVTGRSEGALKSARVELGDKTTVIRSDTASLTDLDGLASQVRADFGAIDVLFVNAGIAKFAPLETSSPELFDDIFNVNVRGAFFAIQKLSPLIKSPGAIVLNASAVDQKGLPATSVYAASKAALRSFARTLSAELQPQGIRVNVVSPGPVTTPIYGKLGMDEAGQSAFAQQVTDTNPMKRFGNPEEIARAVLFLASEESSYILGAELAVDGGYTNL